MCSSLSQVRFTCLYSRLAAWVLFAVGPMAVGTAQDISEFSGEQLFNHSWSRKEDTRGTHGLGPLFNARSCVECHQLGGTGGSGANENNLLLLAVHWDQLTTTEARQAARSAADDLHPDLSEVPAIVVHQSGVDADFDEWRMFVLGAKTRDKNPTDKAKTKAYQALTRRIRQAQGPLFYSVRHVPLVLTQRNTPALFGAGLIDTIDDQDLRELADEQLGLSMGISGRVAISNQTEDNRNLLGRFGWKGQTATLSEFVEAACANELGLQTDTHAQPEFKTPMRGGNKENRFIDLSAEQTHRMIEFVRHLPPPTRPASINTRAKAGETIFRNLGCAHCHVPDVGNVEGLFSDLLLHDMGESLADPVPTNLPSDKRRPQPMTSGYGVSQVVMNEISPGTALEQSREWRTPPLWGVADSAPYLHDGRAATLHDAIAWHDGEALMVRVRYLALPDEGKANLHAFLQTLVGPNNQGPFSDHLAAGGR